MKKFLIMLSLLVGCNANAGLINIDLSADNVGVGETITVNLIATNFDPFDSFDLDFEFDNSLFAYQVGTFHSDLLAEFPLFFQESENINGLAISYLNFVPVIAADFLLASFKVTALGDGISTFSLGNVTFNNFIFTVDVDSSARNLVTVNQVPEPATWILLLFALVFITKRKFSHK